jgi:hypothetical protein
MCPATGPAPGLLHRTMSRQAKDRDGKFSEAEQSAHRTAYHHFPQFQGFLSWPFPSSQILRDKLTRCVKLGSRDAERDSLEASDARALCEMRKGSQTKREMNKTSPDYPDCRR